MHFVLLTICHNYEECIGDNRSCCDCERVARVSATCFYCHSSYILYSQISIRCVDFVLGYCHAYEYWKDKVLSRWSSNHFKCLHHCIRKWRVFNHIWRLQRATQYSDPDWLWKLGWLRGNDGVFCACNVDICCRASNRTRIYFNIQRSSWLRFYRDPVHCLHNSIYITPWNVAALRRATVRKKPK